MRSYDDHIKQTRRSYFIMGFAWGCLLMAILIQVALQLAP